MTVDAVRFAFEPVDECTEMFPPRLIYIKNHGILASIFVSFTLESCLIGAAHGGDVQITDAAFAGFFNTFLKVTDVTVVAELPFRLDNNLYLTFRSLVRWVCCSQETR